MSDSWRSPCGEPAYYPNLAAAPDTGVVEAPLLCGVTATASTQQVEVISRLDAPLFLQAVDAGCAERSIGQLDAFGSGVFTISDTDALAAYAGGARVASRAAVTGVTFTTWTVP